jgi:hypothetical protein
MSFSSRIDKWESPRYFKKLERRLILLDKKALYSYANCPFYVKPQAGFTGFMKSEGENDPDARPGGGVDMDQVELVEKR